MLRQLTSKSVALGLVIAVASIWTYVVALTVAATYHNKSELRAQASADVELLSRQKIFEEKANARLDALERFVFGTLTAEVSKPPVVTKVPPEVWQRNVIADLRAKIDILERWRLEHETEQQELADRLSKLEHRK